MAKISVIYDFHEDGIKPFTMAVRFTAGELDWSKSVFYVPLEAPFQRIMAEDMEDSGEMAVSVLLEDLIVNSQHTNWVGIHIQSIAKRHADSLHTLHNDLQLMIRMCDIEEILHMDMHPYAFQSLPNMR